jgi:predicted molibdopterin-dependent oxidoreductase YjgC
MSRNQRQNPRQDGRPNARQNVRQNMRLTVPLVRDSKGESLRPATWDEALDRAAAGFQAVVDEKGPQAFGMFSCSKTTNEMNFIAQKFTRVAVGSNNVDSCNRT